MDASVITAWFIITTILVIAIYDFVWMTLYGDYATISLVLRRLAGRWPMFPYLVAFAMGALFGHLFL